MDQQELPRYATLFYDVRAKLDISVAEYYLLEMIYHLSFKTGYCYKTASSMATDMGMSKRGVNFMITRLCAKGLLRRLTDDAVKVTQKYYEIQMLSGKKVPTSSPSGKKVPTKPAKSGKKVPAGGKKVPKVGKKFQNNRGIELYKNNIENNSNTNVLLGEKSPVYGKPEINELFDYWQDQVGYGIASKIKSNRAAASNLLRKYGRDKLLSLIRGVALAKGDRYAPNIADFSDLQANTNRLIAWGHKKGMTHAIAQF